MAFEDECNRMYDCQVTFVLIVLNITNVSIMGRTHCVQEAQMARQPKRRPWVRRVIQRVRFTDREPRRLMWRKAIYEEWFEYAKLAGTYPKEFGDLSKYEKFDD